MIARIGRTTADAVGRAQRRPGSPRRSGPFCPTRGEGMISGAEDTSESEWQVMYGICDCSVSAGQTARRSTKRTCRDTRARLKRFTERSGNSDGQWGQFVQSRDLPTDRNTLLTQNRNTGADRSDQREIPSLLCAPACSFCGRGSLVYTARSRKGGNPSVRRNVPLRRSGRLHLSRPASCRSMMYFTRNGSTWVASAWIWACCMLKWNLRQDMPSW